jgi:hypothetical protein
MHNNAYLQGDPRDIPRLSLADVEAEGLGVALQLWDSEVRALLGGARK